MKQIARKKLDCGYTLLVEYEDESDSYLIQLLTYYGDINAQIDVTNRSDLKLAAETLMKAYERSAPK